MDWSGHILVVILALAFDALIGDPDRIWRKFPHPVVWMGRAVGFFDRVWNRESWSFRQRQVAGALAAALLACGAAILGILIERGAQQIPFGSFALALVASIFIAQRSLYEHVARVRDAFTEGRLESARRAVAMIVGRDPQQLDEAGVCRAAIESCAENFSDGVVAPVFWLAVLGLPGLLVYKIVNTADSMIGHRSARHEAFGWASARLDDVLNLIPARISGLLVVFAAGAGQGSIRRAFGIMTRDARNHRSPNAGWPESAMAGALDLALVGPRRYGTREVIDPFLNPQGSMQAVPRDIARSLRILLAACVLQAAIYGALALLV